MRVEDCVKNVRQKIHELIKERAKHHHGAHDGHVRRMDGVDRNRSKTRDAEEAFQEKRPGEEIGDRQRHIGDDRNERVPEDVPRHDRPSGKPLRARRQHIRLIDLVQNRRAEEADVRPKGREDADQDRQDEVERALVAPHGKEARLVGQEELAGQHPDDVVDAHQNRGDEQDRVEQS